MLLKYFALTIPFSPYNVHRPDFISILQRRNKLLISKHQGSFYMDSPRHLYSKNCSVSFNKYLLISLFINQPWPQGLQNFLTATSTT